MATTAARLAAACHVSGCAFWLSILAARDGSAVAADGSLTASAWGHSSLFYLRARVLDKH